MRRGGRMGGQPAERDAERSNGGRKLVADRDVRIRHLGIAFAFAPFNREASRGVARWDGASTGFLGVLTLAWQASWLPG